MSQPIRHSRWSAVIAGAFVALALTAGEASLRPALAADALADAPKAHQLPMHAVVNGQNIQPRRDQLNALGYSDLTQRDAEEVDRLYRKLLQNSAATTATQKSS